MFRIAHLPPTSAPHRCLPPTIPTFHPSPSHITAPPNCVPVRAGKGEGLRREKLIGKVNGCRWHRCSWIGVVAPWFLEPPHCSLDVAQVPVPRATPSSPFEAWPKAVVGLVLGPAVMSEGPSSPKGESTAFSRVGFPGSREASSHPCQRLQEREVPSTGRREGVSGGLPPPAHPPPASPRRPVATFISAARGQCWFPTMSQLAARNGRPLSPGRGAGPPLPGPGLAGRCGPAAGASGGAFGQESERRKVLFWEQVETQAVPCGCSSLPGRSCAPAQFSEL